MASCRKVLLDVRTITSGFLTVMSGKLSAQGEMIDRRWIERGKAPEHRGNETDLHHIGATVGTGGQAQTNADFSKER